VKKPTAGSGKVRGRAGDFSSFSKREKVVGRHWVEVGAKRNYETRKKPRIHPRAKDHEEARMRDQHAPGLGTARAVVRHR